METFNDLSYTTYVSSTVDSVINCSKLLLYYYSRTEYEDFKISLNNLNSVYNEVLNPEKRHSYLIIQNRSEKELGDSTRLSYFKYSLNEARMSGLNTGFNVIIYLDSNLVPCGFTEFRDIIGVNSNLDISISLNSIVTEKSPITVKFLLDSITDNINLIDKDSIGDRLMDYTSSSTYFNNLNKVCGKYTSSITSLSTNKSIIYQQSQIITEQGIYKLDILRNRDIDPFRVGFNRFHIGRYGEDIALYEWVKESNRIIKYCIYSLTKKTKFGDLKQYIHTRSDEGYLLIPIMKRGNEFVLSLDILYASGRFLVCKGTYSNGDTEIRLLNTEVEDPYWVDLDPNFICLTEGTEKSKYIHLDQSKVNSTTDSVLEILEKLPNLYSTFLNTKNLMSFSIKRIIGDWYLLRKNSSAGIVYYLTSNSMSVCFSEEDLENMIIINNNAILLKEEDYYVMYNTLGKSFYTERIRARLKNCFLIKDENGILFAKSDDNSDGDYSDKTYKEYYDKEIIKIIPKSSDLKDTYLNNFRRNSYPWNIEGIPNIIGATNGIIFYINDNKINYL